MTPDSTISIECQILLSIVFRAGSTSVHIQFMEVHLCTMNSFLIVFFGKVTPGIAWKVRNILCYRDVISINFVYSLIISIYYIDTKSIHLTPYKDVPFESLTILGWTGVVRVTERFWFYRLFHGDYEKLFDLVPSSSLCHRSTRHRIKVHPSSFYFF